MPELQLRPHQERAVNQMLEKNIGQIIVPTGGGKTLVAIQDCVREFRSQTPKTVVVVAPRILLSCQHSSEFLEHIDNAHILHVHSGETEHLSTTKSEFISLWEDNIEGHKLIFTTYHSLKKIVEAKIDIDTVYFDEAHNSVKSHFYPAVEYMSDMAGRVYYFTATPRHSSVKHRAGMNDKEVYGDVICNVPAPELVNGGYIVKPKVIVKDLDFVTPKHQLADIDCTHLISCIDEYKIAKAMVCAKAVKQIKALMERTNFADQLKERGYSYMYISAATGAIIDGKKVPREEFFKTLNKWGADNDKKFVVLHYSILSEGINVSGLEGVIFMRCMDFTAISQTVGRVIRLHCEDAMNLKNGSLNPGDLSSYRKGFGYCIVPCYTRATNKVAVALQQVVDTIFEEGQPAITMVRR